MAQARRSAAAARQEETPPEPQETETGGAVIEQAGGRRESLNERMDTVEQATHNLIKEVRGFNERTEDLRGTLETYKRDEEKVHDELSEQLAELNDSVKGLSARVAAIDQKPPIKVREPLTGNLITRNARRLWREMKPGPVNRDHVKGAVVTNLAEYFALISMAQIAPVATMNVVSSALFI